MYRNKVLYLSVLMTILLISGFASTAQEGKSREQIKATTEVRESEVRLKSMIGQLRAGGSNFGPIIPEVKQVLQRQKNSLRAMLSDLGQTLSVEYITTDESGDTYRVTFEKEVSAWTIKLLPNGTLTDIRFLNDRSGVVR